MKSHVRVFCFGMVLILLAGCRSGTPSVQLDGRDQSAGLHELAAAATDADHESPAVVPAADATTEAPRDQALAAHNEADDDTSWTARLWERFNKPKRVPLPRTDLDGGDTASASNMSSFNSLNGF